MGLDWNNFQRDRQRPRALGDFLPMSAEVIAGFGITWSAIAFIFVWVLTKQEKLGALIEAVNALKDEIAGQSRHGTELALMRQSIAHLESTIGGTNGGIVLDIHQLKNNLSRLVPGFSDVR